MADIHSNKRDNQMVSREKIIERLQQEGDKTIDLFSSLTNREWTALVYFENIDWHVKDLLAHFISAEKSFLFLFNNILENEQGSPEKFSIDEFNNSQVLKMKNIQKEDLIELFRVTRAQTINWLKIITETDLQKNGRHPAMGEVKIIDMVKMIYLHNLMHLRDLRSAIMDQNR
jgi:hypothetical protein